jgi:hypothetical protein
MRIVIKIILPIFVALNFTGCATTKYKAFSSASVGKSSEKLIHGKTPKEATQILGKPMSAFFKGGDIGVYHMVYPISEAEVGMTDLMFNDRLECYEFRFEKEKGYKFDNWSSNTGFTCGAIKGEKLDMSLID